MASIAVALVVALMASVICVPGCSKREDNQLGVQLGHGGPPVRLELAFPEPEVNQASRLLATFRLINVSTVPVWLNRRMSFNDDLTPGPLKELWIRVRRRDGTPMPTSCVGRSLPPLDSDYRALAPGEAVSATIDVSCLSLSRGDYELVARFADGNEHPPGPPKGAVPFVGHEIQSPVVTLTVR